MIHICSFKGHDLCWCVFCSLSRGFLGWVGALAFDLRITWIQPGSSGIEMEEFIREPARIEDGCLGSFPSLTLDGVSMYGC